MKTAPCTSNTASGLNQYPARRRTMTATLPTKDEAADFWENHYAKMEKPSSGRPSAVMTRFVEERTAGHALDLGCARGDDAIWLAKRGWRVKGVDIAEAAVQAARLAARKADTEPQITFERHDLTKTFPEGSYDLATAMFLYTPEESDRAKILRKAAAAISPGGLLLIAAHGSRAPWSWAAPDTIYPTAQDELNDLALDPEHWHQLFVGPIERKATGPDGQQAMVIDNVVAVERR